MPILAPTSKYKVLKLEKGGSYLFLRNPRRSYEIAERRTDGFNACAMGSSRPKL
jgi:hypothetical protein